MTVTSCSPLIEVNAYPGVDVDVWRASAKCCCWLAFSTISPAFAIIGTASPVYDDPTIRPPSAYPDVADLMAAIVEIIVAVAVIAKAIQPHHWLVDCGAASMAAIPPATLAIAMAIVPATCAAGSFIVDIA